jgi:hypothetical protein
MSARLSRVELEGNWGAWLAGVAGWRRGANGLWTGGGAVLLDGRAPGSMRIDIDILQTSGNKRISVGDDHFHVADMESATPPTLSDATAFNLNHVAINFRPDNTALVECLKAGETDIFLERERRYDPTVDALVDAEHLVSDDTLYLTARFLPTLRRGSELSHVGWQVKDRGTVQRTAALLRGLDWPIVFGPDIVDGSFLVHFRGPDNRVHDVFHVMGH